MGKIYGATGSSRWITGGALSNNVAAYYSRSTANTELNDVLSGKMTSNVAVAAVWGGAIGIGAAADKIGTASDTRWRDTNDETLKHL
jgi:hypothetical protein